MKKPAKKFEISASAYQKILAQIQQSITQTQNQIVDFIVVKSLKIDIYGRYVADVFLPSKNEFDVQKVADLGVYLNQQLLDLKVVEKF